MTTTRNRKLAGDVLRSARFRTLEAATAAEGIALASEHLPDVILMDLRLPDLDGAEAARILAGRAADVAHTGRGGDGPATRCPRRLVLAAGFAGYIVKPIDIDAFPDLVRGFCASVLSDMSRGRTVAAGDGVPASPAHAGRHGWHAIDVLVRSRKRMQTLRRRNERRNP